MGAISLAPAAFAADMTGAGATFPYPIYAKWAEAYKAKTGSNMNYQSIGSSGGIKQIKAKTVDFGATDNPVKFDDLEKDGLVQFPAIIGGVVPVINVEGVKPYELKLSPDTLSDIFQGVITNWNDKRIVLNNPGMKMPDLPITVVHRADGSGTTAIFTNYLAKVSQNWKDAVGEGAAVKWPAASSVGGKGNEGVAANVSRVKGAIGYVEYAYAKKNKIAWAQLKNRDGNFVQPDDSAFKAAASGADWANAPGMYLLLTNQTGKDSWPATGASFILMHKQQADALTGRAILKFFDWSYKNGAKMSEELEYVHMPQSVIKLVQDNWRRDLKGSDGNSIWK